MLLTSLLRLFLGKRLKPYKLVTKKDFIPDYSGKKLGLYIHIPFCKVICPFCPYYKIPYSKDLMAKYIESLKIEISIVVKRIKNKSFTIDSVYYGGGTPALAGESLIELNRLIKENFTIKGPIGIELNPEDITIEQLKLLKENGFNMVSLGVQSFSRSLNKMLGRVYNPVEDRIKLVKNMGFEVVDIDLIFGIRSQTSIDLKEDFSKAVELGATQISTYPFIDFSYLKNRYKHYGEKYKRKFINDLYKVSRDLEFKRDSVWTFKKRGFEPYTSVTRDTFIGFGASAASLGIDSFKTNLFSVEEYIKSIDRGEIPSNLTMIFDKRTRELYWLFWHSYRGVLRDREYYNLFSRSIERDFKVTLLLGSILGFWKKQGRNWKLTNRGLYIFHLVEQHFTHQYIDKTWRVSMENPWVESLKLY